MTLCSMLLEKNGDKIKHIFLTADTRILNEKGNFTDKGQKIFHFTKNVIVAVAGDYDWFMKFIYNKMQKSITVTTIQNKEVKDILNIISNILFCEMKSAPQDLDMFIVIRDSKTKELCPYQISTSDCYKHDELSGELHTIGLDKQKRAEFQYAFGKLKEKMSPDENNHFNNIRPVLGAYIALPTSEISGFPTAICIDEKHWAALDVEMFLDKGQHLIENRSNPDLTWSIIVNGVKVQVTTKDFGAIMKELNTVHGSRKGRKLEE